MRKLTNSEFQVAINTLVRRTDVIRSDDISPSLYDMLDPLLDERISIRCVLSVLNDALVFIQMPDDLSWAFAAERLLFNKWAAELTTKYSSIIGVFMTEPACFDAVNSTWIEAFAKLTDTLVERGLDNNETVIKFTILLVTIIKLMYLNNLPLVALECVNVWVKMDLGPKDPCNIMGCALDRNVVRVEQGNNYIYHNTLTNRSIRLPHDQEFHPLHYVAIGCESLSGYEIDLAYYGMSTEVAEKLLSEIGLNA